jgi:hypothetical protein
MKKQFLFIAVFFMTGKLFAQGTFSGDLMMNLNFFMKDTNIKASGNPLYDNALSGSDAWLSMRYAINGYTFFARADGFDNSNLKNPVSPNTDFGIGAWSITKEMDDLSITVGSIYDQIGSGILFRSYEDRGLLIDNALMGFQLKYKFSDKFSMKGFTGQMKNNNSDNNLINNVRYAPVVKGISGEGDLNVGKAHLVPGFGALNRTLDGASMNNVAAGINALDTADRFLPRYNMYAFTAYNTLTYKNLSWYVEGAYKTHEAILITNQYDPHFGKLADRDGNIVYTSVNYGRKGLALSLTGKRTEDFTMRTSPNETVLKGMLNWQPIVAVMRPLRLMSRYTPASQDQSEMAGTAQMNISPNDVTTFTLTYTHINTLTNEKLYREAYAEGVYQGMDKWVLEGGVQYIEYNLDAYQIRSIPFLTLYGITPFAELTYKITDNKSLRMEMQYMHANQDYGSWAFALLEYNIAPKWSFTISDMYNVKPNPGADNLNYKNPGNHYYNFFMAHTRGANRFTLAYVKQVDGINCSGGVCRYEPAFSGVKATVTSSF